MSSKNRNFVLEKRETRDSMERARQLFNSNLNQLTTIAVNKNPKEDSIAKIREILRAAQAADGTIIIVQAGPYVWKYRDQISKHDEKFFIDNNFEEDIAEASKKIKNHDFSESEIAGIMQGLKQTYKFLTEPEKNVVWKHVTDLLRAYATYLGCEKKIMQIEEDLKSLSA